MTLNARFSLLICSSLLFAGAGCASISPASPPYVPVTAPSPVPPPEPAPTPASGTLEVGEKDKNATLPATVGEIVDLVLHSTYWTIQRPDAAILKPLMPEPKVTPDFRGVPGSGSGTVEMRYQVIGAGTAQLSATRTSCGEAMLCTGENGKFRVSITATRPE